jgi:hypothetical protein
METITEAEELRRGELLARVLNLKPIKYKTYLIDGKKPVLFETEWGNKTALGLFRTAERIILDGE